jgi:hypothetical protein
MLVPFAWPAALFGDGWWRKMVLLLVPSPLLSSPLPLLPGLSMGGLGFRE